MDYFPFFLDIREKPVLLVGGGEIAQRKAELLLRAGCDLQVVAPTISAGFAALLRKHGIQPHRRPYEEADIANATLVISATDNEEVNRNVSAHCRRIKTPVNVVDAPALSDFIFPAIVDRAPLVVAASSAGASPVLARRVREKIETALPPATGKLAELCNHLRQAVKDALPFPKRRLFWEDIIDSDIAEDLLGGKISAADAEALILQRLADYAEDKSAGGQVYLIGAGPGAADLLTLRALRLLQKADVIVHDRLVSNEVLSLARRDAERIFVGKQSGNHAVRQEQINELLVSLARQNLHVARLKGGDPFIFGRGGEELQALAAAGIPVQVVPGISAANGCAAALEVPLSHRNMASSIRIIAISEQDRKNPAYWRHLAQDTDTTQVYYMAGAMFAEICQRLVAADAPPDTPALLVCGGTTAAQQYFCGTLATLPEQVADKWFSPALLIVGEVAALARQPINPDDSINTVFNTIGEEVHAIS